MGRGLLLDKVTISLAVISNYAQTKCVGLIDVLVVFCLLGWLVLGYILLSYCQSM